MNKRGLLLFVFITISVVGYSQNIQRQINDQVWKPFITTFNNYDTEGFMAVHSHDLIRVPRDSKTVLNFEQYKKQYEGGDKQAAQQKAKRIIELRFIERMANENQAFEAGIYKTTNINAQGESKSFYGKFHVVLRKENGTWKILVDSDSSEGGSIGEKDFIAAKPLE
jgi:ketosteroid isomerase-like protein